MGAHYFLIYRHCVFEFGFGFGSGLGLGFTWDRFAVAVVIDLNKSRSEQVKSSVATVGAINALLMK